MSIEHDFIFDFGSFGRIFYYFCEFYLNLFNPACADVLITYLQYILLGELYHGQILIDLDIKLYDFNLFSIDPISNAADVKMPDHG